MLCSPGGSRQPLPQATVPEPHQPACLHRLCCAHLCGSYALASLGASLHAPSNLGAQEAARAARMRASGLISADAFAEEAAAREASAGEGGAAAAADADPIAAEHQYQVRPCCWSCLACVGQSSRETGGARGFMGGRHSCPWPPWPQSAHLQTPFTSRTS